MLRIWRVICSERNIVLLTRRDLHLKSCLNYKKHTSLVRGMVLCFWCTKAVKSLKSSSLKWWLVTSGVSLIGCVYEDKTQSGSGPRVAFTLKRLLKSWPRINLGWQSGFSLALRQMTIVWQFSRIRPVIGQGILVTYGHLNCGATFLKRFHVCYPPGQNKLNVAPLISQIMQHP